MKKILTLKEFKDEITPFIKAYKRDSACECFDIFDEVEAGGFIWFLEIWKWMKTDTKDSSFEMATHFYKEGEDEEGEHIYYSIESSNTMTEIVDFFCFEYNRGILKKITNTE